MRRRRSHEVDLRNVLQTEGQRVVCDGLQKSRTGQGRGHDARTHDERYAELGQLRLAVAGHVGVRLVLVRFVFQLGFFR